MRPKLRTFSGPRNIEVSDYLESSLQIYNWIDSNKIRGKNGIYYAVNPGSAEDYSNRAVHGKYGLYSGSAGIGIYLIRLYDITNEEKYLDEAKSVLDEIIANAKTEGFYENKIKTAPESDLGVTGWHTGIYSGPSGAGILALNFHKITGEKSFLDYAIKLGRDIEDAATDTPEGKYVTKDTDIFSDGGFVLYFISLYKATKEAKYIDLARDFARYIYSTRIIADVQATSGSDESTDTIQGSYYETNNLSKVGLPRHSIFPGFAHGTAGIGFIFSVLYQYDKKDWELEGAKEAAAFLESISKKYDEGRLIPYLWGDETGEDFKDKYYIGFCHGPAGSSLLYRKLFEVTGDEHYLNIVKELAHGILEAGAPEFNSWGLWNSYCTCCGTPGLIEYFISLYEFTKDDKYLDVAKRAAARVIADSTEVENGRTFFGHWDRTNHRDVQTYTGLYTGAAGPGANLLRLYGVIKGIKVTELWEYGYLGK